MSIKVDNHGYLKLKYPIVLYTVKLQFSNIYFSEKVVSSTWNQRVLQRWNTRNPPPPPPKRKQTGERTWQHLESSFLVPFCRPQPKTQNPSNSCAQTRPSELSTLLQQCPTTSSSLFSPLSQLSQYMAFFITASP